MTVHFLVATVLQLMTPAIAETRSYTHRGFDEDNLTFNRPNAQNVFTLEFPSVAAVKPPSYANCSRTTGNFNTTLTEEEEGGHDHYFTVLQLKRK